MSLTKCPPSIILINPKIAPKNNDNQINISFLVKKYNIIIENPTEASPDTKEQFVLHESDIWYHAVKFSFPPDWRISPGLDLPQLLFRKKYINSK